jgi:putative aminopeptidase FrvX
VTAAPDLQWLAELCSLPGVSGDEARVRAAVWRRVRPLAHEAWVDPLGSLVVTRNWRGGGPRVLLCAHLDEVGLIVTGADEEGLLRCAAVGGLDPRVLPGCPVRVGPDGVPGVVALPPAHLLPRGRRERAPAIEDLRIDIGAASRARAEQAVRPGDLAVFATVPGPLGRLFRARALDDRAGVCALVAAAEEAVRSGLAARLPLALVFTVQEEIGTRGAAAVAEALEADACVVVETTTAADLPDVPEQRRTTRLGGGPALTALDAGLIADRALTGELVAAAEALGIPYQWKEAAAGGTDGARFQETAAAVAVVSLPCRYLHAPASVLDPRDLEALTRLLAGWLGRRAAGQGGMGA